MVLSELAVAGAELMRRGIERDGIARVRLRDAIEAAGLPTSTAYRNLRALNSGDGPQAAFERLVVDHIQQIAIASVRRPSSLAEQVFSKVANADTERISPRNRGRLLVEVVRSASQLNATQYRDDTAWTTYLTCRAAHSLEVDTDYQSLLRYMRFIEIYTKIANTFRFGLRAGLTWEDFASIAATIAEKEAPKSSSQSERSMFTLALMPILYCWFVPLDDPAYTVLPPLESLIDREIASRKGLATEGDPVVM